jgi:Fe-S-cluster containining protein
MDENSPQFKERLAKFICQRCNECCKKPGFVYLKEGEAEAIAGHLGMGDFDFVNQYCELLDRQKLVLKKHPDESCIFLTPTGCAVHAVKPLQCRDFPMKWRTPASLEYCAGLKKVMA